jgi:5-methylcytosine-specific restriction endonuclease McrA
MSGLHPCPLRHPEADTPGKCGWCAAALTGRRTRWCSNECRDTYLGDHFWTWARAAAIDRARFGTWEQGLGLPLCDQCGVPTTAPEVNHVVPRDGAGYGDGCHHHQTNLQVLCHSCHVAETVRQRRERPIWDALEHGAITPAEAARALNDMYAYLGSRRRGSRVGLPASQEVLGLVA